MRYAGTIGFAVPKETSPGVWDDEQIERTYYGDFNRRAKRYVDVGIDSQGQVNSSISLNHEITIVADAFAHENYSNILYAVVSGRKWRVSSVEVRPPRLLLNLTGLYNG